MTITITALTELTDVDSGDWFVIDDTSANATKKVDWKTVKKEVFIIACSDENTVITATGEKAEFRMPYAFTVTAVRGSLTTACTTGTFTVDINESGTTILSTKLTFDATEKTTTTAATTAVISDTALADDAEIQIDVDNVGDSLATGLKIYIIGYQT